jgi:hypothetical protein
MFDSSLSHLERLRRGDLKGLKFLCCIKNFYNDIAILLCPSGTTELTFAAGPGSSRWFIFCRFHGFKTFFYKLYDHVGDIFFTGRFNAF